MSEQQAQRRISGGMLVGSAGTICSRVTGLARDIVFASVWGTGSVLGAFVIAFTIPNMFRRLFGEGALSEAFVPVFNEELSRAGKRAAFLLLTQVVVLVGMLLLGICAVGLGLALLLRGVIPGELAAQTLAVLPWVLPYLLFICLAGLLAGVLQSFGRFAVPAFAPVLMNLSLIAAALWLCPRLRSTEVFEATGLAWAVLVAGALQLLAQVPVLRRLGYRFKRPPALVSPTVRRVGRLFVPGMVGAGVYQVNLLCDRLLAGWLGSYAVTSLYYSERLVYLPVGVFAVALGAACLPVMSRAFARREGEQMVSALVYALRHILFLSLPCLAGLLVLGERIITLVFRRGAFTGESASATLAALTFYAAGVPAFAALKIIRHGFYAQQDTRTPMRVGVACMGLNLVLNLVLMWPLQQRGLALATSISALVQCTLLLLLLYRRLQPAAGVLAPLALAAGRCVLAAAAAAAVMWACRMDVDGMARLPARLLELGVPAAAGAAAYLGVAVVLRAREPRELWAVVRRRG